MTVPIATGGKFLRDSGLTVVITGHDTTGVAVCNYVRSFDLEARVRAGSAGFVESLSSVIIDEIINRVISIINPAD